MRFVSGGDGALDQALRDLLAEWADCEAAWRDDARRDFAERHLDGIVDRAREAVVAIKRLDALLREGIQRCS
ncbi:MAG TPA: hypothetical protein VEL07_09930 [Planctomycetota bacterium]|nr:hypothetical protein [Planctomycetota bacterium]